MKKMTCLLMLALAIFCLAGCTRSTSAMPEREQPVVSAQNDVAGRDDSTSSTGEPTEPAAPEGDSWLDELTEAVALGEYPNWDEWVTEDQFNRVLAAKGSHFEPQGDYTWDNGIGLTVAVETSLARGLGSDDRWHIVPYYAGGFAHTPSPGFTSQVWRDERWISRYVVDERGMSQRLAEDLWTLLLYSDSLETLADNILSIDGMKEELANK
ncbi:hypothetical protein FWG86_01480 [Candidatus Saccharibacteria bacterium]|nr:hypothetical protein [Candidatus Saccharibacteria bacterium]